MVLVQASLMLEIVAQRDSGRMCEKHEEPIIDVLVRSDQLKNDWVMSICQSCHDEAAAENEDDE